MHAAMPRPDQSDVTNTVCWRPCHGGRSAFFMPSCIVLLTSVQACCALASTPPWTNRAWRAASQTWCDPASPMSRCQTSWAWPSRRQIQAQSRHVSQPPAAGCLMHAVQVCPDWPAQQRQLLGLNCRLSPSVLHCTVQGSALYCASEFQSVLPCVHQVLPSRVGHGSGLMRDTMLLV